MRRVHAPSGRALFQVPRPADAPPPTEGENTAREAAGPEVAGPEAAPDAPLPSAVVAKRPKFAPPTTATPTTSAPPPRPPLAALAMSNAPTAAVGPSTTAPAAPAAPAAYYTVLYCKRSGKKRINKSFADGVMEVKGDARLCLMDDEGKVIGRTRLKGCGGGLPPGATGEVGGWEFEVVEPAPAAQFASGELFIGRGGDVAGGGGGAASALALSTRPAGAAGGGPSRAPLRHAGMGGGRGAATRTAPTTTTTTLPPPLFDPAAPDALVLDPGTPGVSTAVVADPFLVRRMRPHQREGLAFLYAAVTGARTPGQTGCVLAHEMGLGKTLTSLALMWTLLRQGPAGRPLGRRTVVACPSSLVENWAAEARKWLGDERFKVIALRPGGDGPAAIAGFLHGGVHPCMIASYEALRKIGPSLAGRVDLLVCDEGHRLKAAGGNQTIAALKAIACRRVVLLTGTPLQNDLSELYAVLDFVAPGFLGTHAAFTRVFADPIARARDPAAKPADRDLGARRAEELASRVGAIILKGPPAAVVNAASLPPCGIFDVFVRLTAAQAAAYKAVLASKVVMSLTGGRGGVASTSVLPAIGLLRSLCISPGLALGRRGGGGGGGDGDGEDDDLHAGATARDAGLPALLRSLGAADAANPATSSKLAAAGAIASAAVSRGDKVVIVSTSTSALDAIDRYFTGTTLSLTTVRIDGGVDAARRQAVVDAFNNARGLGGPAFGGQVLLLSMRAGGAGLNLVGAAVMVMLDMDWNPAVCAQAAARCWRPGQTRPCCVIRLHAAGGIDERLLQRLHHKAGLSVALEGGGGAAAVAGGGPSKPARRASTPAFTPAELRALFTLDAGVATCCTRGLLVKGAAGDGGPTSAAWAVDAREVVDEEDGAALAAAPLLAAAAGAASVTWCHREPLAGEVPREEEEAAGPEDTPGGADPGPTPAQPAATDGVDELELDA